MFADQFCRSRRRGNRHRANRRENLFAYHVAQTGGTPSHPDIDHLGQGIELELAEREVRGAHARSISIICLIFRDSSAMANGFVIISIPGARNWVRVVASSA